MAWLLAAVCGLHAAPGDTPQRGSPAPDYTTSAEYEAACGRQLNIIYGAIQQYRKQHGKLLPDKLSDLMPDHLNDPNVLICPFVRSRGGLRLWKKKFKELTPDAHTSYSYELPAVPLPPSLWRGVPRKTWREFKLRVMEVEEVGPVVPMVRCHDHRPRLNLAYDGRIYQSDLYWERKFIRDEHRLMPARLFAVPAPGRRSGPENFPPRDPAADGRLVDLTQFYNAALSHSWQGFEENHLGRLPVGLQEFGGVGFDARGVIQLRGSDLPAPFPDRVEGIKVHQRCRRVHFLHAASFDFHSGSTNGIYTLHFADGRAAEIPVIYGRHTADWWFDPDKPAPPAEARVAWSGENNAAKAYGRSIRLYVFTWENSWPDTELVTVSFAVGPTLDGPFLVALTVE
jgi:hypothetical protein